MAKTINKLYKNPKAALKAVEALKAKGFSDSEGASGADSALAEVTGCGGVASQAR